MLEHIEREALLRTLSKIDKIDNSPSINAAAEEKETNAMTYRADDARYDADTANEAPRQLGEILQTVKECAKAGKYSCQCSVKNRCFYQTIASLKLFGYVVEYTVLNAEKCERDSKYLEQNSVITVCWK